MCQRPPFERGARGDGRRRRPVCPAAAAGTWDAQSPEMQGYDEEDLNSGVDERRG